MTLTELKEKVEQYQGECRTEDIEDLVGRENMLMVPFYHDLHPISSDEAISGHVFAKLGNKKVVLPYVCLESETDFGEYFDETTFFVMREADAIYLQKVLAFQEKMISNIKSFL